MPSLIAFALGLSMLLSPQDVSGKVKDLLDRMREDDISVSDQAMTDLVRLGPPAIEPLKGYLIRAEGEEKVRIEGVLKKIERTQKVNRAMGALPDVTLHAKDRPVAEILAELVKQSGVAIEGKDLATDERATLDVERVTIWKAVDELCRGHKNLMYGYSPRKILIKAAPYRNLPRAFEGQGFFFVDRVESSDRFNEGGAASSSFMMVGGLVWPASAPRFNGSLQVTILEDDKGTNLLEGNQGAGGGAVSRGGPDNGGTKSPGFCQGVNFYAQRKPADDAKVLARCKGQLVLKFPVEMQSLVVLKDPTANTGAEESAGKNSLKISRWTLEGRRLRFSCVVMTYHTREEGWNPAGEEVILRDKKGNVIQGEVRDSGSSGSGDSNGMTLTKTCSAMFVLPEGAEAGSLELVKPLETEEVVIPFDFKDLPLK